MKKYIALLFIFLFFLSPQTAHALLVNLSQKEINNAINFGKMYKKTIEKEIDQHYRFGGTQRFDESGIIRTKWCKIALMSGLNSQKGKDISKDELSNILENTNLQIDLIVYGHSIHFARDYKVFLIQNGITIKPERQHASHFQNHLPGKKALTGFPSYWAAIGAYFNYKQIIPNGKAVVLIKKDGRESRFDIDFSKFK